MSAARLTRKPLGRCCQASFSLELALVCLCAILSRKLASQSSQAARCTMTHPTPSVIVKSPDILSGTPVFAGTRVPIKNLLDYVRAGESVAEFLDDFPSVSRDQVDSVLALAETLLMETVDAHTA